MTGWRRDRAFVILLGVLLCPLILLGLILFAALCLAMAAADKYGSAREAALNAKGWHPWFAWRPVRLDKWSDDMVRFRTVERRRNNGGWDYR